MRELVAISNKAFRMEIAGVASDFVAIADHIVGAVPLRATRRLLAVLVRSACLVAIQEVRTSVVIATPRVALEVVITSI